MQAQQNVVDAVLMAISQLGFESIDASLLLARLEKPKSADHGDIAFPCFALSKALKKAPPAIAAMLMPEVEKAIESISSLEKVVQVGPYLNFFVSCSALAEVVSEINGGNYLEQRAPVGEKVMIEYSQPNTHKAFHVGHMRNVALGDALVRMYRYTGHDVVAANYIGDEGAHIAKCLWAYGLHENLDVPETHKGEFLGGLYREADQRLDFKNLTAYPFPGVEVAQVVSVQPHKENEKWTIVELCTGSGTETVVCGGQGFGAGDKIPFVPLGQRFGGRLMEERDMKGITSRGMMCSEKELGISQKKEQILIFDKDAEVGQAITELGRVKGALAEDVLVADEMARRQSEVSETLKALEDKNSPIQDLWKTTRQWSLDDFQAIYDWVDCHFDHYFYESEVGEDGKQLVLKALEEGVLTRSEGTVGADLSAHKLGYLMLLKSDGTGLYATKDIALAERKFNEFEIDRSIYVVDYSQSLHFSQVFKTLELMGYEQADKCHHLAYGLVTVPEGKMSSRKGTVIFFSELQQKLTQHIKEEQLNKNLGEWTQEEVDHAAHGIAIATIKYGMLNQDNLKNIVFDLEEWTSLTGNTGPYLLYAYARTSSIARKVGDVKADFNGERLTHETERALLNELNAFQQVVDKAVELHRPQGLCIYLYNLSRCFSRMFEHCSVSHAEDEELKATRLALVTATGSVLKTGLGLLGISTLEKM